MDFINITVENRNGERQELELPTDMGLSDALKANEYNILATCGGMVLCATCHVEVLEGGENLNPLSDAELDILDTLPDAGQIAGWAASYIINDAMHQSVFKIRERGVKFTLTVAKGDNNIMPGVLC